MSAPSDLTPEDIRLLRECGEEYQRLRREAHELSARVLAEKFGVSAGTIWGIWSRAVWHHVR